MEKISFSLLYLQFEKCACTKQNKIKMIHTSNVIFSEVALCHILSILYFVLQTCKPRWQRYGDCDKPGPQDN